MNRFLGFSATVFVFVAVTISPGNAQARSVLDMPTAHKAVSGNLAEVLRFVSEQYRVPVIGELLFPVPTNLAIESGEDSAIGVLSKLIPQISGYEYEVIAGHILHVYEHDVVSAKGSPLNIQVKHFTMPPTLSDFKLTLPAALNSARKGLPTRGLVISGFPSTDMEKKKLEPRDFSDVSGRELLILAAEDAPDFYSLIVLSDKSCRSDACFDYANEHWFWGPLKGSLSADPIYIQSPRP
jgi:hypothetical protein